MATRICKSCEKEKDLSEFYRNRKGYHTSCKPCVCANTYESKQKYAETHREENKARGKAYRLELRLFALERYGKICYCCAEHRWQFLSIDHPNNDGAAHRREISGRRDFGGYQFLPWLKRNGWPDGFRVACDNCNMARAFYGVCPHESERTGVLITAIDSTLVGDPFCVASSGNVV